MRTTLSLLAGALILCLATTASGMIMDSSGTVTDWGITPFTQTNGSDFQNGTIWSTIENNYSPISYPGVGHVPSPGGTEGELFDLEEMHLRIKDNNLQVLVVMSSPLSVQAAGNTWYLGDLMLTIGQQQFGVVTQHASQGLAAGAVYRLGGSGDSVALQSGGGSYLGYTNLVANDYGPNDTVQNIAGPWAVKSSIDPSKWLETADIATATHSYGGAENNTFLIEYTVGLDALGVQSTDNASAKTAWGCGNDVIRVQDSATYVPEPATLALLAGGAALTWLSRKRQRAA